MEIRIEKFNEIYIRIQCEPSIAKELYEFFSFEVPNARYMRAVQNRIWSGRVHLFSPATGKIYLGLLPYVEKFLQEQGHSIQYDSDFSKRNLDKSITATFVHSLETEKIKARDYQIDAVHNILEHDRGLILSPTGSGKSFIIYALVRYYVQKNLKVLIVVPTTSLVEQMYTDFIDYGWSSDDYCHRVYGGRERDTDKAVIISTWQSIYNQNKKYFSQFGVVFVDEAHLAKAKSLVGIMTKLTDCKYRIGLTGTLDGTEVHRLVLEGLFNVHEEVTTTAELIERKELSNLHISCLVLEHTRENRILMKGKTYQQEMEYLSTHRKRNLFISKLVADLEGNTLVLAQYIEKQLVPLCMMITEMCDDRTVHFISGATPTDDREKIRGLVEQSDDCIVVASYGTFSLGVNVKRIHNIVFASPYKSQIKVLQSIGRGLRTAADKEVLKLFDIADSLVYNNRENYTLKHLRERINIYNEQGFEYQIIPVTLK